MRIREPVENRHRDDALNISERGNCFQEICVVRITGTEKEGTPHAEKKKEHIIMCAKKKRAPGAPGSAEKKRSRQAHGWQPPEPWGQATSPSKGAARSYR